MALPLENCCIERQMPKGYTWAKFVQCWTGDPESGKFFEESVNQATGETMPAAYFTVLRIYDRDQGWTERDVKLQGQDAVWAVMELQEKNQVALLTAEGHVATRSFEGYDGRIIVRSTTHIKQGTVRLHAIQASASAQPLVHPSPSDLKAADEAIGLQEWPEPGPSESSLLDDAPF